MEVLLLFSPLLLMWLLSCILEAFQPPKKAAPTRSRHRRRSSRNKPARRVSGANFTEPYSGLQHTPVKLKTGGSISQREDRHLPGVVYLVKRGGHSKVGITSKRLGMQRVNDHRRHGWLLVECWDTPTLVDAHKVERLVLRKWKTWAGTRTRLTVSDVPQGGVSETAFLSRHQVDDTRVFIGKQVDLINNTKRDDTQLKASDSGSAIDVIGTVMRLAPERRHRDDTSRQFVWWWKIELATPRGHITLEVPEVKLRPKRPAIKSKLRARGVLEVHDGHFLIAEPDIAQPSARKTATTASPATSHKAGKTVCGTIVSIHRTNGIVIDTGSGTVTVRGTTRPSLLGLGVQVRLTGTFTGQPSSQEVVNPGWEVIGHRRGQSAA